MQWVLLIYISTVSAAGGVTIGTAEFNSEKACVAAAEKAKDAFDSFFVQKPKTLCVSKG